MEFLVTFVSILLKITTWPDRRVRIIYQEILLRICTQISPFDSANCMSFKLARRDHVRGGQRANAKGASINLVVCRQLRGRVFSK